jgi:PPOX class probable F420-dependent enzyme
MAVIPDAVRAKLQEANFWHLATLNDDGMPTTTPVWVDVDDGHVLVNTAIGRRKEKNVRRDPRVALSMTYPEDPYSWIEIRGKVIEFAEGERADKSIDKLAKKYLNEDVYPFRKPGERRVLLRIEPDQVIVPSY